ncbi:MAG: PepSY domain-containing protein [Steroidobacteraceae bacterium]
MTVWRVVRYWLYIVHRWLGICACLLFVVWFASGLIMSHVGYPQAQPERRQRALQPIDWSQVRLDPDGLLAYLDLQRYPRELRLEMLLGVPVYRVIDWDGTRAVVSARTGERHGPVESEQAVTIAQTYANARGKLLATIVRDQWTVPGGFNPWRPLHRIAMDDAARTEVYVSAKTGEVVLATTGTQRFWNWLGTVPHWIYFTPLRANQPLWRQVILWTSGPAMLLGVTGIWIGVLRLRSQYRGWKNWHHWSGIVGGLFLLSWIVSGWLSVNPNGWLSGASPDAETLLRYAGHDGADLPVDFAKLAHESARTVRFFHIDGMPIAAPVLTDGTEPLLDARTGERVALTDAQLIHAARRLMPDRQLIEHGRIEAYDSYWYAHHNRPPLPVLRVVFGDPQHTWFYIDPSSGLVLDLLDDGGRRFRWWFNALHRLDFSWLVQNRVLWHATVWVLCLAGLTISASGSVIGWRRLRRKRRHQAK